MCATRTIRSLNTAFPQPALGAALRILERLREPFALRALASRACRQLPGLPRLHRSSNFPKDRLGARQRDAEIRCHRKQCFDGGLGTGVRGDSCHQLATRSGDGLRSKAGANRGSPPDRT